MGRSIGESVALSLGIFWHCSLRTLLQSSCCNYMLFLFIPGMLLQKLVLAIEVSTHQIGKICP